MIVSEPFEVHANDVSKKLKFKYQFNKIALPFIHAILAGMFIGIGGIVYLSISIPIVGAFLFAVGLYCIYLCKFDLFTGKVGYLVIQPLKKEREKISPVLKYILYLLEVILGNFVGAFITAKLFSLSRNFTPEILSKVSSMVNTKLNDSPLSLLILGFFCGMLMYVATADNNNYYTDTAKRFICVAVFILCGFEHSIADMFYFSLAETWSLFTFTQLLYIIVGNTLGAMLVCKTDNHLISRVFQQYKSR
jgi:formate/nitrite transporter FocA (FNT family)